MRLSRSAQQSDGSVLAEMILAGAVFVVVAAAVADYAVSRKTSPVSIVHIEPGPPTLILSE
ncbi:MAG: hypothetical protein AAGA38_17205 [Pseudomonadota bacterium]